MRKIKGWTSAPSEQMPPSLRFLLTDRIWHDELRTIVKEGRVWTWYPIPLPPKSFPSKDEAMRYAEGFRWGP